MRGAPACRARSQDIENRNGLRDNLIEFRQVFGVLETPAGRGPRRGACPHGEDKGPEGLRGFKGVDLRRLGRVLDASEHRLQLPRLANAFVHQPEMNEIGQQFDSQLASLDLSQELKMFSAASLMVSTGISL